MNVCVVGLGFVGLSMSVVLASRNFQVVGVDTDLEKIKMISAGEPPFFEPKLKNFLKNTLNQNFTVTSELEEAVKNSEIIFICVGTPSNPDGSVDLQYIRNTSKQIGEILKNSSDFKIVVVKSTVSPNTTDNMVKTNLENTSSKTMGKDFGLCMNPEFLKEGSAIDDMLSTHLVVIGSDDEKTKNKMHEFYAKLYKNNIPKILHTNIVNAEMIKYTNNAFLATKISFINTIANICNKLKGADVEVIAEAIGQDPRIGPLFLKAGPGFGGSCFPKDVSGFLNFSSSLGYKPTLIESTQKVNKDQAAIIIKMIEKKISNLNEKTISILGLSFKKNTDDIRESVSIKIVRELLSKNAIIKVHDPMAMNNFKKLFPSRIEYCSNPIDCISYSDCCVVLTDWDEYKELKFEDFKKNMKCSNLIDARRIFVPSQMSGLNFSAIGYGN